jgi:hypothetical protein
MPATKLEVQSLREIRNGFSRALSWKPRTSEAAEKHKLLKGTACLAAASFRPYITNLESVRL